MTGPAGTLAAWARAFGRHLVGNVPGYLALFVALGGTSYAVATGSIDGREIRNGSVRGVDLRNDDVTSADVHDGTLRGGDVRDGTLQGRDILPSSLGSREVEGLTAKDFAPGTLPTIRSSRSLRSLGVVPASNGGRAVTLGSGQDTSEEVPCIPGTVVIGGGGAFYTSGQVDSRFALVGSRRSPNGEAWRTTWRNVSGATASADLYADATCIAPAHIGIPAYEGG